MKTKLSWEEFIELHSQRFSEEQVEWYLNTYYIVGYTLMSTEEGDGWYLYAVKK